MSSALHDLARDPASRKRFLSMAGGAGAASAFAVLLAACGDDSGDRSEAPTPPTSTVTSTNSEVDPRGDLEILAYALELEHIEADFYEQVVESGVIEERRSADLVKRFGATEAAHVDRLEETIRRLGGTPAPPGETKFAPVIERGREKVLQTAADVENLGAAAYLGQASAIQDKEVLAVALSIHSVEARHAAALNRLVGRGFGDGENRLRGTLPDGSTARAMNMDEVLDRIKPFLA